MHKLIRLLLILVTFMFGQPAWADWPERPIRVVVPYAPGAMGDVLMRLLSQELRNELGQNVIVDNKPGASGNIGAAAVAQAAPDGYTLLVGATNNFVINQFLFKQMGFDPLKAFEPITVVVDVPPVAFVSAEVPAMTFAEFTRYAKANPGKVNYASPGIGTAPHLSTEMVNRAYGLGMTHVSYSGAGPALTALMGNQVQLYLVGAGLGVQHVKSGKLRALAVSSAARLEVLPDTPTFAEAGVTGVAAPNWWGAAAPAGTPKPILDRLNAAFRTALSAPAVRNQLVSLGVVGVANSRDQMARQLVQEADQFAKVIKELGITSTASN